VPTRDPNDPENGETDLAAALLAAGSLCPDEKEAALLLVTDGNETTGSALAELALGGERAAIFSLVPAPAAPPPATIRRLVVPAVAPEHAVLPLEAIVESRAPGPIPAVLKIG